MPGPNARVAALGRDDAAEDAIRRLSQAGSPMEQASTVGRGHNTKERPAGFHAEGDRILGWRGSGALRGGDWGLLLGAGMFPWPGMGGASAIAAALTNLGLPKNDALRLEAEVKTDKFLTSIPGTAEQGARAREVLREQGRAAPVAAPAQAAQPVAAGPGPMPPPFGCHAATGGP